MTSRDVDIEKVETMSSQITGHRLFCGFIFFMLISGIAGAKEIKGIKLPEQITQPQTGQTLVLNGAGIRAKFIFDIYVGALYLTRTSSDPKQIIDSPAPKRITMYFVYGKIKKKTMTDAWDDAFDDALDKAAYQALKTRIAQFDSFFPDIDKGDKVVIDFVPKRGAVISINGQRKGVVTGDDFQRALLRIWLGDSPADESLKKGMLGISED